MCVIPGRYDRSPFSSGWLMIRGAIHDVSLWYPVVLAEEKHYAKIKSQTRGLSTHHAIVDGQ